MHSTEVTREHEDRSLVAPQVTEPHAVPVLVEDRHRREIVGARQHDRIVSCDPRMWSSRGHGFVSQALSELELDAVLLLVSTGAVITDDRE